MKRIFLPILAVSLMCFANVHGADQTGEGSSASSSATSDTWQKVGLGLGAAAVVTVADKFLFSSVTIGFVPRYCWLYGN